MAPARSAFFWVGTPRALPWEHHLALLARLQITYFSAALSTDLGRVWDGQNCVTSMFFHLCLAMFFDTLFCFVFYLISTTYLQAQPSKHIGKTMVFARFPNNCVLTTAHLK